MRIGTILGHGRPFHELASEAADYESAGLDSATLGEAYSFDAVSQLGYLAARTSRIELATGILALDTRTPADARHDRRRPRLGFRGAISTRDRSLRAPGGGRIPRCTLRRRLGKTRKVIGICRTVWRREPLRHRGRHYNVPLPADRGTGLGKPLKLINHLVRPDIPISIAALGDQMVELTAELAQGWEPIFFHPEKMHEVWGEALRRGSAKRDPALDELNIIVRLPFAIVEDTAPWLDRARPQLALYIGGMGSREHNFYNTLACSTDSPTRQRRSRIFSWPDVMPKPRPRFPTNSSAPPRSSARRPTSRNASRCWTNSVSDCSTSYRWHPSTPSGSQRSMSFALRSTEPHHTLRKENREPHRHP